MASIKSGGYVLNLIVMTAFCVLKWGGKVCEKRWGRQNRFRYKLEWGL